MILLHYYKKIEFFLLRKIGFISFKEIGRDSIVKYGLYGDAGNISIGKYVYIGENAQFWGLGGISIGDGTIIGPNVTIRSSNHDYKSWDFLPYGPWVEKRPVCIGKNVWVGEKVCIAPGTNIGEWVIIGMWSVVSWDIEDFSIVVWNPAKIIKKRDKKIYNTLNHEKKIYLKYKLQWKI